MTSSEDPTRHLGTRVAKRFDGTLYYGTIASYFNEDTYMFEGAVHRSWGLWRVEYDDGDEEDFDAAELRDAIELYNASASTSTSSRKRRREVVDVCSSDDETKAKMECIMCVAHGRTPQTSLDDPTQLLPVRLKPTRGKGAPKITVAHVHTACALRAPPSSPCGRGKNSKTAPEWWTEVAETTHGHPGQASSRVDSTSSGFVPYVMTFSDWVDEFALYDYRKLRASVRRFDERRLPPYNSVGGTAVLWRGDDRGSIGFCRMVPQLTQRALELHLSQSEAALWGSIVYRCFNRLSTFSRWAAVKTIAAKEKLSVASVLSNRGRGDSSIYEEWCHGPPGVRREEFHAIAASGVTLHGRHGYRDRWGREFCEAQMDGAPTPMRCVAELPLPSEIQEFKTFIKWESRQGRGVMTGEHQVQSKDRILPMLQRLAVGDCARLRTMNALFRSANSTKTVLDELQKLDTVGPFFAWQIFSDLVAVQHLCQLFPDDAILPSAVVQDSLFGYALFGPGARKGAYILDGGASTVLEYDKDTSQKIALARSKRILAEFPRALQRMGLEGSWDECARGRPYDLETLEHSLCGFYGVMADHCLDVIENDPKSSAALAKMAKECNCAWPPEAGGPSHSASTREKQGGPAWRPNPCTALEREDLARMVLATGHAKDGGKREVKVEEGRIDLGPAANVDGYVR